MRNEEFLIVVASDTITLSEVYSRVARSLEGSLIHKDDFTPYMIIKSSKEKIDRIKQYILILALIEKEFQNKLNYIDRADLF